MPPHLEPVVAEMVQRLTAALQDDLRAIILYGSAASGHYHPKKSNVNALVITSRHTATGWERLQPFAKAWLRHHVGLPLWFTETEWQTWARSFPIEFLDIQAHHRVLYGEDVVAALPIDRARLTWQCESELRGKLLCLRQALIAQPPRDALQQMLERSIASLVPVFRALLHLRGHAPLAQSQEIVAAVARVYGVPGDAFGELLQIKAGRARESHARLRRALARSLAALEQLSTAADRLSAPPAHA